MRLNYFLFFTFIYMIPNSVQAQTVPWSKNIKPPIASKKVHIRNMHGEAISDPYYWMIDFFKHGADSTEVVQYLEAENDYLKKMMNSTEELQQKLFTEMKNRIQEKDESVPYLKNGYYYYSRTDDGKQYYKFCRKKGSLNADEEILLDVDRLAEGHAYYALGGFSISPDNNYLVYGEDIVSRRQYAMKIKDLRTGITKDQGIQHTSANYVWANDSKTIFYTANNPETLLSEKIKRHIIHTPVAEDLVVYEEKDNTNYIGVKKTSAENYILIESQSTVSSEIRYLNADIPTDRFQIFQPRIKNVLYSVDADDKAFYITTNKDALNFKIMKTNFDNTNETHWKEWIAHRKEVLVEGITLFKNYTIISETQEGLDKIRIINKASGKDEYLSFKEKVYAASPTGNAEYKSDILRCSYVSMTTPSSIYDINLITNESTLKKQQKVLGGFSSDDYQAERIYATAKDGTKIPISIVYKKGFKKEGKQPLLLYAYGSYGISMSPSFSSARLSLLNRGFAFAIAHIRGGQEMGRQWYEDGKLMKKKNTFTDFIDCAEFLIKEKYTSSKHLYANGGSAGGLLMGAIATMAPKLFNGVVADVPFVDVVNTMLDTSIPLTTNEYDEWGNPEQVDAYQYMKSYSPYENVTPMEYPNLLVTTGLHDSQVQYFEPAKWVAKLRATKKGNQVLFLKTNMAFGHGGASGRFDYLKDVALMYAFFLKLEGKEN